MRELVVSKFNVDDRVCYMLLLVRLYLSLGQKMANGDLEDSTGESTDSMIDGRVMEILPM